MLYFAVYNFILCNPVMWSEICVIILLSASNCSCCLHVSFILQKYNWFYNYPVWPHFNDGGTIVLHFLREIWTRDLRFLIHDALSHVAALAHGLRNHSLCGWLVVQQLSDSCLQDLNSWYSNWLRLVLEFGFWKLRKMLHNFCDLIKIWTPHVFFIIRPRIRIICCTA